MSVNKSSQTGFTIVELLMTVSLMGIIGVTFLAVISNYFVVINRNNQLAEMTIYSQNLLRSTVENIRLGDGVRQTNTLPDANAPVGGWNTNNTSFVIILAVPALDSTKNYIIDSNTGSPYMNELVYYKNGKQLMERKLADGSATGNILHTSCPPALATASCPADTFLADYVNSMLFTFYDQDAALTTDPTAARSIKIDLSMQRNAPGQPIVVSNSIRVTLRNRF